MELSGSAKVVAPITEFVLRNLCTAHARMLVPLLHTRVYTWKCYSLYVLPPLVNLAMLQELC